MVMADSLVKFEGPAVELEHGTVRVTTSHGLAARAGDVTVKPAGNSWTEFQVTDVDGRVQIAANKGDVTVQDDKGTTTVAQGDQTTRDDTTDTAKKKKKRKHDGAQPAAGGGILSSTPAVIVGGSAIVGLGIWVGVQNGSPLSHLARRIPVSDWIMRVLAVNFLPDFLSAGFVPVSSGGGD